MQTNDEMLSNVVLKLCLMCMYNDEKKFKPNGVDFGVDYKQYKIGRCSLGFRAI